jgi:hypothetical protein
MNKIRFLNLFHNGIGEIGFKMIADCDSMPLLTELRIYEGNLCSVESKNALKRARIMQCLRHIS